MTCDQAINLINARMDGRIAPTDAVLLEEHLANCADCRNEAKAVAAQDVKMRDSFASHQAAAKRMADRVVAELHRKPRIRRIAPWWSLIASAAAGFAIAWIVLRPWQRNAQMAVHPTTSPINAIGQLDLATGAVEFRPVGSDSWSALSAGAPIIAGSQVRTGPAARCELHMNDGSEIRLNENTQIAVASYRQFELITGEAWSNFGAGPYDPFELTSRAATFSCPESRVDHDEPQHTTLHPTHPVEFVVQAAQAQAKLITLQGNVLACTSEQKQIVPTGQQATCSDGHVVEQRTVDLAFATKWLDEILILKGRDNPELNQRIDDLFAQIGATKIDFMYEDEIRGLGDHCVLPLLRYIESDRSAGQEYKRALAAKIVSDVAPTWAIPELLGLLNDSDGDVRASAATALQRLTGQNLGRSPQAWHDDSPLLCEPTEQAWQQWWQSNREQFPGASTQPTVIVKQPQMMQKG
jgi:ferric-dicitrate binding protein FerR (iron transport regulator)